MSAWIVGFALLGLVGGALLVQGVRNSRRQGEKLAMGLDGAALAMHVPRRERAPDGTRAWALIQEARVLLASAEGAFVLTREFQPDGSEEDHTQDDVLDAVTHLREVFGLLREAAELDPTVDRILAPHDPWTEPAWLDAIHMGTTTAGGALQDGREWISAATRSLRQIPEPR